MGMGPALVQRQDLTQAHIRTGFSSSLLLGGLFALILYLTSPYIAAFFGMPELNEVLDVVALIFVVDSFSVVSLSLLQRRMRMRLYAISDVISYGLGYGVVGIALAASGYGIWALVYGRLAQSVFKAILASYFEPHSVIPYWNQEAFRDLISFGGGYTIAKIANYVALQGDYLVVGKWLGADALGYYSRAYQIIGAPSALIGGSLDTALFPAMSSVQKDKKKLQNAFLRSVELIALVSLPATVLIIINAPEIVLILLGENWTQAIIPLQILGAGLLLRMSYKVSDSLARALGVVYKRAWRQIVYAAAVFSGAYLGSFWGINGVAIGVTVAIFLNFILMAHLGLSQLNIGWARFLGRHLRAATFALITAAVSYLCITQLRVYVENLYVRELVFLLIIGTFLLLGFYYFRRQLKIEKEVSDITLHLKKHIRHATEKA
jgi:PST family polysaccharide transporter